MRDRKHPFSPIQEHSSPFTGIMIASSFPKQQCKMQGLSHTDMLVKTPPHVVLVHKELPHNDTVYSSTV